MKAKIDGMACGHCVARVKAALEEIGGQQVEVDLASGIATFVGSLTREQVMQAIDDAGFTVTDFQA